MHMVAHDLKSPLNNIQSLRGLLQKNVEKLVAGSEKKEQSLTLLQMISIPVIKPRPLSGFVVCG